MTTKSEYEDAQAKQSFDKKVASCLAKYLSNTSTTNNLKPLFEICGCPHLQFKFGRPGLKIQKHVPLAYEETVTQTLIRIVPTITPKDRFYRWPDINFSVICGLATNSRWRRCLATADDAYFFAASLAELYVLPATSDVAKRLRAKAQTGVCHILNEWFGMAIPAKDSPTPAAIVESLFGVAWCEIALSNIEPDQIPGAIRSLRPPFLPGLVIAQAESHAAALPALDTP